MTFRSIIKNNHMEQDNTEIAKAAVLPRYRCHKVVSALKIAAIEIHEDGNATIAFEEAGYEPVTTEDGEYGRKFKGSEEDTGYYVVYEDDYVSWSPTKAFEDGYRRIDGNMGIGE